MPQRIMPFGPHWIDSNDGGPRDRSGQASGVQSGYSGTEAEAERAFVVIATKRKVNEKMLWVWICIFFFF
jgi:hypothetical protein